MTRLRTSVIILLSASGALRAAAQQSSTPGMSALVVSPSVSSWSFRKAIRSDSFDVEGATQVSFPASVTLRAGRLTVDAGGAYTSGQVRLADGRTLVLSGLTDVRVRGVAQVVEDRLLLTVGLNLPTGASELSGHQVDALGVLGGTALGFSSLALGNGFGATAGLVWAFRGGPWGIALGSSFEARSQYTPLEARIAGTPAPADFDPGDTRRVSLALDRLIGRGRMSVLLAADFYGENLLQVTPPGAASYESRYTPGPQYSGAVLLDLGVSGFRSFRASMANRYRAAFTGADGRTAEGSEGNVLEFALEAVKGGSRGAALYVRADARFDSGLEVDNTIATAAMSAVGVSLGLSVVRGSLSALPFVRAQAGRLDAGTSSTGATGFGAGFTIVARP